MPLAPSTTRPVTVRLPAGTRDRLDALSRSTDRPVAQLVRYALLDYLPDDPADVPVNLFSAAHPSGASKHLTVRLPLVLADAVDSAAAARGLTASDVIREAIDTWLPGATTTSLGQPSIARSGG